VGGCGRPMARLGGPIAHLVGALRTVRLKPWRLACRSAQNASTLRGLSTLGQEPRGSVSGGQRTSTLRPPRSRYLRPRGAEEARTSPGSGEQAVESIRAEAAPPAASPLPPPPQAVDGIPLPPPLAGTGGSSCGVREASPLGAIPGPPPPAVSSMAGSIPGPPPLFPEDVGFAGPSPSSLTAPGLQGAIPGPPPPTTPSVEGPIPGPPPHTTPSAEASVPLTTPSIPGPPPPVSDTLAGMIPGPPPLAADGFPSPPQAPVHSAPERAPGAPLASSHSSIPMSAQIPGPPPIAQADIPRDAARKESVVSATQTSGDAATAGMVPPPPGPPPPLAEPRSFDAIADDSRQQGRPLTAAEQYERLKHFLPMTQEPETDRPSPQDLKVGTRLRVEWSKAWWAARVREEGESTVKIGFDTWSSQYDEWIPRDSQRLRLPLPDDKDLEAENSKARPLDADTPQETPPSHQSRPFNPKPYNPEREFQKRQLRLKEKIAAMQKVKLGAADSSFTYSKVPENRAGLAKEAEARHATPESPANIASTGAEARLRADEALAAIPSAPEQSAESRSSPAVQATPPEPSIAPVPQTSAAESAANSERAAAGITGAGALGGDAPERAAPSSVSKQLHGEAAAAGVAGHSSLQPSQVQPSAAEAETPAVAARAAAGGAAGEASSHSASGAVRWEELLTADQTRYYHEMSTGRTQWELPAEGWVQLLADDGSHYYWNCATNVTQWHTPTE